MQEETPIYDKVVSDRNMDWNKNGTRIQTQLHYHPGAFKGGQHKEIHLRYQTKQNK